MIKTKELTDPKSCLNKAKDDELLFVLLGRDPAAAVAVQAWINERIRIGKNKPNDPKIIEATEAIKQMSPPVAVCDCPCHKGQSKTPSFVNAMPCMLCQDNHHFNQDGQWLKEKSLHD